MEQYENVIINYHRKGSQGRVLLMGQMKAYYKNAMKQKQNFRRGAGCGLEDFADYHFRFHGKRIIQISMMPINQYRLNVGNYKPYLTLQNDRL